VASAIMGGSGTVVSKVEGGGGEGGGRAAAGGECAGEVFLPGVVVVGGAAGFAQGDVVGGVDGVVVVEMAGQVSYS
jgi:hypothetical protein